VAPAADLAVLRFLELEVGLEVGPRVRAQSRSATDAPLLAYLRSTPESLRLSGPPGQA